MGALTNDPAKLARFSGVFATMQSAGGAASFGMDAALTPLLNEHLASWSLLLISFPFAFLVLRVVKETNYEDEKVVYAKELDHSSALEDDMKQEKSEKVEMISVLI